MQPVDVHQVEDVSEVFVESADLHTQEDLVKENLALVLEDDVIDLEESAIDNILLTIPMQVLSDEECQSDDMPSGQNWSVMTEEQYEALQNEKKKKQPIFCAKWLV